MASYRVTHRCGHGRDYRLFGQHAERERKLAWLATVACPTCRARDEPPRVAVDVGHHRVRIAVANSYAVKDVLAERGYVFERFGYTPPGDFIGARARPAWVWRGDLAAAKPELRWIAAQEPWVIEGHTGAAALIRSVGLGDRGLADSYPPST